MAPEAPNPIRSIEPTACDAVGVVGVVIILD